ncbi:MAG: tetratricopeptide repeat protein [Flavobacteriales bacterium]|nr:tetratricopeptide repeat protein [Flavobacteriales bacterium]
MKKYFLILTLLLKIAIEGIGKTISIADPNLLYSEGKYEEAYSMYEKLIKQGIVSEVLYYNLANAAYKTGRYAEAVLNYKKALRINPKNSDARFNLKITQQMLIDKKTDYTEVGLSKILHTIRYSLSMDGWAWLQILWLFLAVFSFVAVYLVSQIQLKKVLFLLSFLFLIPAGISFGFAQWQFAELHTPEAVIMSSSVNVYSEPSENSTVLFILHGGSSVDIIQSKDQWMKISFEGEKIGWLKAENTALVQIP